MEIFNDLTYLLLFHDWQKPVEEIFMSGSLGFKEAHNSSDIFNGNQKWFEKLHKPRVYTYTMGTAPFAFRSFIQLRIQTNKMISARTGVTQNDLPSLLTHFTVILVVSLKWQNPGKRYLLWGKMFKEIAIVHVFRWITQEYFWKRGSFSGH